MGHFQLNSYSALERTSIAIGVFDGVHLGHQSVLKQCRDAAFSAKLRAVCLTFDPHPLEILAPARAPEYICSLSQRIDFLLQSRLVDDVIIVPFTLELAQLSPQQFVEEVLMRKLNAAQICVGADFRYGKGRAGSVMDLESAGDTLGFRVNIVHAVAADGHRISSTSVRQSIETGDIPAANRLLGREFTLRGTIVEGKKLGKTIGFPTINLKTETERQLLPADGVYAGYTQIASSGRPIRSAISVGTNPTTDKDNTRKVEAFLLDGFDTDVYAERADISFVGKIREQIHYTDLNDLLDQIKIDVDTIENSITRRDLV
jgi:riboflavin kinase/FMN adenylyltransferase